MVLSWPPFFFTWKSMERLRADERAGERDEIKRMVANSQMPGPQTPAVALGRLGIANAPVQRCQP